MPMLLRNATCNVAPIGCRRTWALALAVLLCGVPGVALAQPAQTSVVTMGDSYIAGEGGRWLGNSANPAADRDGTDRACVFTLGLCTSYDLGRVYVGGTAANRCHRADVAEVASARLPVDLRINLACSGAVTENLLRASSGGTPRYGEGQQADRLLEVARSSRVRMIVVSVGGNDLDFGPIVQACFTGYLSLGAPCSQAKASALSDARLASVTAKIVRVVDDIRAVMREAGYAQRHYRLVLQTYPIVLPHAAEARYAQGDLARTVDGCPFYDADMDWANDVAAPRIGRAVKAAAAERRVEVLELLRAFEGHEICATTAAVATLRVRPSPAGSEWGRGVSASTIVEGSTQEVSMQELFHPNAHGHRALGGCLGAMYASRPGSYSCVPGAGRRPQDMQLRPLRGFGTLRLPAYRPPRR